MTREAIEKLIGYAEDQACPVQITFDGSEYTADFKHDIHAKVISTELIEAGFEVVYNPPGYYARLQ